MSSMTNEGLLARTVIPLLRAVRYGRKRREGRRAAARPMAGEESRDQVPAAFLFGCGRSGTTLLGGLFANHPEAMYLREPYHLWAAIEPRADVTNFHVDVDGLFFMSESDVTPEARVRFVRTMLLPARAAGKRLLIEKTPHNICRIGYVEALVPDASRTRFVHIVRDGVDVVRSIDRLAAASAYRVGGKPNYNQWWGNFGRKWESLSRDGAAAGYFPNEVGSLTTHAERGAYEWLCSLGEADRWRSHLGDRMLEIRYQDLTGSPREIVPRVCSHLGLRCDAAWLDHAIAPIQPERRNKGGSLRLPAAMADRFNALQIRHGFAGRAETR